MRKRSKTPKAKAKAAAWTAFSAYIRQRDPKCVTCVGPNQQAGHFIDGRHNAVLFSEKGVHSQCYHCNVGLKGNKIQYWLFMERTYGRKIINKLIAESKNTVQYKANDYLEIAKKYRERAKNLSDKQ